MMKSLQVWLVLLALLCPLCVMGQTSTPTVLRFTGGELTYTNANTYAQTIVRVVVSTTTSVTNTVTFSYSQGLQWTTGRVVSSTSFRTAYWPASTGSVATILYTGDKIRISQTYTGVTFATMDVIRGVGGGGDSGSNVLVVSGGATLYTGDRDDGEAIVWDAASNRYEHAAVPTVITSYVYGIDYPKLALVTYQRTSYYAKAYIDADLFAPNVPTNAFPVPGTHPEWWGVFLPPGHDGTGSAGPAGEDGIDGIGNLFFGPWSASFYYATNLYTNIVVSRLGKWYRAIGTSSNAAPESNTNVWEISIDPGTSATVFPTNLMWRGWYNAATTYASNDSVTVTSGLWAVTGTNSVTGVAPPTSYTGTSAVWTIVVPSIQGPQGTTGAQGPAGQDSIVSNIVQYTVYLGSNTVFLNSPTPTNPWLQYISSTNGTNYYTWSDLPPSITNRTLLHATTLRGTTLFLSGTNAITDDGTNMLRNGIAIGTGGDGSGTLTNVAVGGGSSSLLTVTNGAGPNVVLNLSSLVATGDQWDADIADSQNISTSAAAAAQSTASAALAGNQTANATSVVGRAYSTNAPTAGATLVWNSGTSAWEPSSSPPVSSSNAVSSVNGSVGAVTIQGAGGITVTTAGASNGTITVSGGALKAAMLPVAASVSGSTNHAFKALVTGTGAVAQAWTELQYDDTVVQHAPFFIPATQTAPLAGGSVTARVAWVAAGGTNVGDVVWCLQFAVRGSGNQLQSAYQAPRVFTNSSAAVTNAVNVATVEFTPSSNEMVAGSAVSVLLWRETTNAGDTLSGRARLIEAGVYQ